MGRSEPTLVPEWLRISKAGSTSNAKSDEHGYGHSLRSRLSVLEAPPSRNSQHTDGNNSDNSAKPPSYRNFGRRGGRRNNFDNLELDERGRPLSVGIGSCGYRDTISGLRGSTDSSWSARSLEFGKRGEYRHRSLEDDLDDLVPPKKPPFKWEFPSLRVDGKQTGVGNGLKPASPVATRKSPGLNMAETLSRTSTRASAPNLTVDTQRTNELAQRQSRQLRPLTPKTSVFNSDKSKPKGARGGHALSSQLAMVNNALLALKSDAPKASQGSNFQVLDREGNVKISSSAARDVDELGITAKNPTNQKLKTESKGNNVHSLSSLRRSSSSSFGERKPPSRAQNRIDFFNSLRKKESANPSTNIFPDPGSCVTDASEKSVPLDEQNSGNRVGASVINQGVDSNSNGDVESVGSDVDALGEEGQVVEKGFQSDCHVYDEDKCNQPSCYSDGNYDPVVVGDELEIAFLLSLGWEEHARVEAIREEEKADFRKRYQNFHVEKLPSSQLKQPVLRAIN